MYYEKSAYLYTGCFPSKHVNLQLLVENYHTLAGVSLKHKLAHISVVNEPTPI